MRYREIGPQRAFVLEDRSPLSRRGLSNAVTPPLLMPDSIAESPHKAMLVPAFKGHLPSKPAIRGEDAVDACPSDKPGAIENAPGRVPGDHLSMEQTIDHVALVLHGAIRQKSAP